MKDKGKIFKVTYTYWVEGEEKEDNIIIYSLTAPLAMKEVKIFLDNTKGIARITEVYAM